MSQVKNLPSLGVRIIGTGIENNVKATHITWEVINNKNVATKKLGLADAELAYADVVIIGYRENLLSYKDMIDFHISCIGASNEFRKANKPKKPIFFKQVRLYWYPPESEGDKAGNLGIRDILLRMKDELGNVKKYVEAGDKHIKMALRVLDAYHAQHKEGSHLVTRCRTSKVGSRVLLSRLQGEGNQLWHSNDPGCRSNKQWEEDIHGQAVKDFLHYKELCKGTNGVRLTLDIDLGAPEDCDVQGL